MKTNATQRSMQHLRNLGWQVAKVEAWIPPRGAMKFGVRRDVWGFGDLLACIPKVTWHDKTTHIQIGEPLPPRIALIQCCSDSGGKAGMQAHKEKILAIPEYRYWKLCGGIVLLHGWKRRKPRGQRAQWILSEEEL